MNVLIMDWLQTTEAVPRWLLLLSPVGASVVAAALFWGLVRAHRAYDRLLAEMIATARY